jgi:hypothetical protein
MLLKPNTFLTKSSVFQILMFLCWIISGWCALASYCIPISTSDTVSPINLTAYWARLEDTVHLFGWEHSASGSQIRQLRQTTTQMVCRSKAMDFAKQGSWDNLDIFTDKVRFMKNETLNEAFCYVSYKVTDYLHLPRCGLCYTYLINKMSLCNSTEWVIVLRKSWGNYWGVHSCYLCFKF